MLIYGDKDKTTPLYLAKRMKKGIKNSKLFVLKNAGHFAFVDKKIEFNSVAREFLLGEM